ncbi:MAG: hypothetical protein DME26_14835, partial [Verrucomicrobia bacterium]
MDGAFLVAANPVLLLLWRGGRATKPMMAETHRNGARRCRARWAVALFLAGLMIPVRANILIATNSVWKFRKGTNEVSSPNDLWRGNTFSDTSWPSASAPLYAGFTSSAGTRLNDMVGAASTNYTCVFLRKSFTVPDASQVVSLMLKAAIDDGFVMWLNGQEVWRFNMTAGGVAYTSLASVSSPSSPYFTSTNVTSPQNFLLTGANVLTIQAFNLAKNNADFYIDTELSVLTSADVQPPAIVSVLPTPSSTVSNLAQVRVLFSKPVVGVTADDLQINGEDAANVTSAGGTNFVFTFTQPAFGNVQVYWDVDHGITDQNGNAFVEGGSWNYTLVDTAPPVITVRSPPADATLARLSQVDVTFSKPVTGIDAADLLVNGQVPASVSGSGSGPYSFTFAQPAPGTVTFSWAPAHGIADSSGNSFMGSGWTVTLNPVAAVGDVVINEFLSSNVAATGLRDEDGQNSDWIELYNRGTTSVNLTGWSLTDDPANPAQWTFPKTNIGPGAFLVVFASGKDRRVSGAPLHTSFSLAEAGEYLGLYGPEMPKQMVHEFTPAFPPQRSDYSYGYDASKALKYFRTPTPGAPNGASSITGVSSPVHFSVGAGFFDAPFNLLLTTTTLGAAIRYTTDGSEPTLANGGEFSGPITITESVVIRAASFGPDLLPSGAGTRTYLFVDSVLTQPDSPAGYPIGNIWGDGTTGVRASYGMDAAIVNDPLYSRPIRAGLTELPTLVVASSIDNLFGPVNGIYSHTSASQTLYRGPAWERPASMELIYPDGSSHYLQIDCGVQIQGGTSRNPNKTPKHSLRLKFKGDYGSAKLDDRLFQDSAVTLFDTIQPDAGFNYCWNYGGTQTSNQQDQRQRAQYVRDQFVSDLQNAMGWPCWHGRFFNVYINHLYWGIYYLHEVPDDSFMASYFGGDKSEYDVLKNTSFGLEVVAGNNTAWNTLLGLANSGLANNAQYEAIQQ